MTLTHLTATDVTARLEALTGLAAETDEALADLLRAEAHGRGMSPRAMVLTRVAKRLRPLFEVSEERLAGICDALEREGDLVTRPGGVLCATPLRAVEAGDRLRVIGSVPSTALRARLGPVEARGPTRAMSHDVGDALRAWGGITLSAEAWSGLDHTPRADAAWLDSLVRRLEWAASPAASLERDEALDWRALTFGDKGPEWRRPPGGGRLWRAKSRYNHWLHAWTEAGASPSNQPFVRLIGDEATRTVFALASSSGRSARGRMERAPTGVHLTLSHYLPNAEYRYVSIHARATERTGKHTTWTLSPERSSEVAETLAQRLSIEWQTSAPRGGPARPSEAKAISDIAPLSTAQPDLESRSPLDEHLPVEAHLGPLLQRLNVYRYRDLLSLDLKTVAARRGVGQLKLKRLHQLINEAERRAGAQVRARTEIERGADVALSPERYDEWHPLHALGQLSSRATAVIEQFQLETIERLREWHEQVDPFEVANYGRKTHDELAEKLSRLIAEGHEALVFGCPAPSSLTDLAARLIARLEPREREVFDRRFPQGQTLEEVAREFGLTRERIRQLVDKALADNRSSWSPRARELLEPAFSVLEASGGIALTRRILELLGNPEPWTIELAMELTEVPFSLDIIEGVSTSMSREEFHALRRELRRETEFRLLGDLSASAVAECMTAAGLNLEAVDLPDLADLLMGVTVDAGRAFPSRRSMVGRCLTVLHEANGPITAEEIARRLNEEDPSSEFSARNVVSAFKRTPQALSFDRGLWIHQDHMPVARAKLDGLARFVLPQVKQANGQAVSARLLLSTLVAEGRAPSSVTPNLLRDALIQTGEVRGWRAGTDVAWLGGDVQRTNVATWIHEVARELDQPFGADELAVEIAERSGNLASTIYANIQNESSRLIPLTRGQFVHPDAIFSSQTAFDTARRKVAEVIQTVSLHSAHGATLDFPGLESLVTRFGRRILWGLASRADGVTTRARGLLMWPTHRGQTVWEVIGDAFLASHPLFRIRDFSAFLASEAGLDNYDVAAVLTSEGVAEGYVRPLGMSWYIDARLQSEQQLDMIDRYPEVIRMALGSQDFVRESPARELFNDVRERHGSFRVPAG